MNSVEHYQVIVVGGGHAGCEAAFASARLGVNTLLLTLDLSTIGLMPCNPSIGGPGKGHLVREIGVFGGEMAKTIDETCIQLKWLNTSRGAAVRARRAQADKMKYRALLLKKIFSTPNLHARQANVSEIIVKNGMICGVKTETGVEFVCERLIIASGTYLNSRIIIGAKSYFGGPQQCRSSVFLPDSLAKNGIPLRRLQTATPPRIHKDSIDIQKMTELPGDPDSGGFLWENRNRFLPGQSSCYLTFTSSETIEAVRRNLKFSPLVLANITNVGPKHCPSIDRKVLKFPQQFQHQIFVEPEGANSAEMYLQGLTTSMPPDSQEEVIKTVPGLENARILRYGYAIEYDALAPLAFRKTLESRFIRGLYTAGQINGTSGYEEAAAQGLVAGANAALSILGREPFIPSRTRSYIGVLIDDLSGWDHPEPYRITPSHAEFRLNLREDTAEMRLIKESAKHKLISDERFEKVDSWLKKISLEYEMLSQMKINPTQALVEKLNATGSGNLKKQISVIELLQRPGIKYSDLTALLGESFVQGLQEKDQIEILENEIHYCGYAHREKDSMVQTEFLESLKLPVVISDDKKEVFSEKVRKILFGNDYDDLIQPFRKGLLTRSDAALLTSIMTGLNSENSNL
ncbi:MAG: tRNA uridine-5-carboxymethylaminomethyl(34) synthesis enzyme MnmG [Candidatus Riflebacteria bacterium]|nr:tRNA uridine-5-carboxymethylaminomethyl(34) synthesis enzyme MnmG [Candidatus Riflebacteria bacterium]